MLNVKIIPQVQIFQQTSLLSDPAVVPSTDIPVIATENRSTVMLVIGIIG